MQFPQWSLDTYLAILGVVLAIIVPWIFYRRALPQIELSYAIEATELLGGSRSALPQELKITYDGHEITNLRKNNYGFWNSGTQPIIRSRDVISNPALLVTFDPKSPMLKPSALKSPRPENGFTVHTSNNTVLEFEFIYLEPSHGFNAEVLYVGDTAPSAPKGTIAGMPAVLKRRNLKREETYGSFVVTSGVLFAMLVVGLAILAPHRDELSAWIELRKVLPKVHRSFFGPSEELFRP
jgi:hypothetical protein